MNKSTQYAVRVCETDLRTGKPLDGYPRAIGPFDFEDEAFDHGQEFADEEAERIGRALVKRVETDDNENTYTRDSAVSERRTIVRITAEVMPMKDPFEIGSEDEASDEDDDL